MKRFKVYRRANLLKTHGVDLVNPPNQVQFEGVVFSDGTVAVRWLTRCRSTSIWTSMSDLMTVHGHPEYDTEVVWLD